MNLSLDALKKAGCEKIFTDKVSGIKVDKPEFKKLLLYAREGDTITNWKRDRLGRSTKEFIELAEMFGKRGVNLIYLNDPIDTVSPGGVLVSQIFFVT